MTHASEANRNHYDKTQVTSPKENIKCLKETEAMGDFLLSFGQHSLIMF